MWIDFKGELVVGCEWLVGCWSSGDNGLGWRIC